MNSRSLKKRVRARMKTTGESYTEAPRAIKAEQERQQPPQEQEK